MQNIPKAPKTPYFNIKSIIQLQATNSNLRDFLTFLEALKPNEVLKSYSQYPPKVLELKSLVKVCSYGAMESWTRMKMKMKMKNFTLPLSFLFSAKARTKGQGE